MNPFEKEIARYNGHGLGALDIDTIQVNIGLRCNLECAHCHVVSSPRRKETMGWTTMEHVISAAEEVCAKLVDITGGAPEMHPHFRRFVSALHEKRLPVMVRTNLTILLESGFETMPEFFREHQVELCASLPCYLEENVDSQRGTGVYEKSIQALRVLNERGYGIEPGLPLNLVYNPVDAALPPNALELEADYKHELRERFGIEFSSLLTITNMPIGQFRRDLKRENKLEDYNRLLQASFNPATLDGLMCRHQIHVGWDGRLYDCDFNYALKLPVGDAYPQYIKDFNPHLLLNRKIQTGFHCFGCTAGSGSSCGGALVE
ncbi:MAG: arsenosugar biosynthesis radical SAM protein ArsS [Candidatus Poribacteria bacterium]|nr:arsenosugar biosynthesis radical SAM protein ArsS [Candidatus Poribacteria bacterium]